MSGDLIPVMFTGATTTLAVTASFHPPLFHDPATAARPGMKPPDGRCGTCAHWRTEEDTREVFGRCDCPRLAYGYVGSYGATVGFAYHVKADEPEDIDWRRGEPGEPVEACADMLLYSDMDSYMAEMLTGRDFGCIHWQEKTP